MPEDLKLLMTDHPGATFLKSRVLLARASIDGTLELLTAAWERTLGYGQDEFRMKMLSQLLWPGMPAGAAAVAILDERDMAPLDVKMRCRDGRGKWFRLYRRFDAYERRMYLLAEERRGH